MGTATPVITTEELQVASWDVDARGHMTTAALGRYLQEIAETNAAGLGAGFDHLRAEGQTWVLVAVLLRTRRLPRWRETVRLSTWPRTVVRRRALRDFQLTDRDGAELAAATTAWYSLDLQTRRPVDPDRWRQTPWAEDRRALDRDPDRLPDLAGAPQSEVPVPLRWSDLDLLGHLTNTRYHDLLLESYPADWLAAHEVATLELNFLAEGTYPATILSRRGPEPDRADTWRHTLVRADDGRQIARARLQWR
jgi:acyl-ACP thioesterase